ncbi:hypothetical protein PENTCL1PPCAC_10060, partial [Pristionchus entomophagus]
EKMEPKKEPIDATETVPVDNQISGQDYSGDFNGNEMLNDDMGDRMEDMANETVDTSLNEPPSNKDMEKESTRTVVRKGSNDAISDDLIEKEGEKESVGHTNALNDPMELDMEKERESGKIVYNAASKESSDSVQVVKRRSSRNASKPPNYNVEPWDDSDLDLEPAEKKSKSDSEKIKNDNVRSSRKKEDQSGSDGKARRISRLNDTELECPECEYRTLNVSTWISHLKKIHSTNPSLASLALSCECGHEGVSHEHSFVCDIAKFTVIRKRDGPIRRLGDEKTTPQCILCEFFPKTPGGYIAHLHRYHKSNLNANGIYLACDCGLEVRTNYDYNHSNGCDKRQFSLHKLGGK